MTTQCETCKHNEKRSCMYPGYPYTVIPESCEYKLGVHAEEAMRNLNGTHIDVWTKEHDAEVRNKTMDEFGILHGDDAKKLYEYMRGETNDSTKL